MDKKAAGKRAEQIATDIEGPVGRVPLERVFAAHLDFFEELRSLGATWPQIAALLKSVGITKKNGGNISGNQVRAMVSRITNNSSRSEREELPHGFTRETPPDSSGRKPQIDSVPTKKQSLSTGSLRERMRTAKAARE